MRGVSHCCQRPFQKDHGNVLVLICSSGRRRAICLSFIIFLSTLRWQDLKYLPRVQSYPLWKRCSVDMASQKQLVSVNGAQYSSILFKAFATEYGFDHVTSSPLFPQANGEAEHAVGTVKGMWKGGGDKGKALLKYRPTPLGNRYSLAQLLMGRQLRTTLPQLPKKVVSMLAGNERVPVLWNKRKEKTAAVLQQASQGPDLSFAARTKCVVAIGENAGICCVSVVSPKILSDWHIRCSDSEKSAHLRPIPQSKQVLTLDTDFESNGQPMPVAEQSDGHSNVTRSGSVPHPPKTMDL